MFHVLCWQAVYLDEVFCLLCRQILPRGLVDCWTACHSWKKNRRETQADLEVTHRSILIILCLIWSDYWSSPSRKKWRDTFSLFSRTHCRRLNPVCDVTCHRVMEVANAGWWSWGRSGCELRLCGGSWEPQSRWSALSGAPSAREAALSMSL